MKRASSKDTMSSESAEWQYKLSSAAADEEQAYSEFSFFIAPNCFVRRKPPP